jgi:PHP family Zn ribbon phosphoesterase
MQEKLNNDLIELIMLGREGKLQVKPGYDGVYGEVLLKPKQLTLV